MKITIEKIVTADTIKKQLPFPIFLRIINKKCVKLSGINFTIVKNGQKMNVIPWNSI